MAIRIRHGAQVHLYIAEHREAKGYTQERLGALLGVGKNTVSRWEIDQKRLNPIKIANIAHALGITPTELWGPPTKRPSIDAMLKNAPDDLAESVAALARSLTRRVS